MRTGKVILLMFICFIALSFMAAKSDAADSGAPKISGTWKVVQKNTSGASFRGTWTLTQQGERVTGTAEWENHLRGSISGKLSGNDVELTVSYPGSLKGFYKGSAAPGCNMSLGGTSTASQGSDGATWSAERQASMDGRWVVQQKNAGGASFKGVWTLAQRGSEVTGSAVWENHQRGEMSGRIAGNDLDLTVSYPDGLKGQYKGVLESKCRLSAKGTSSANRGGDTATWSAEPGE